MNEKEILCLEHNVFCRVLKHAKEFEEYKLSVVLNNIIEEIDRELNIIALEEFEFNHI